MDFSQVKAITIPEGSVNRILSGTTVLWKKVSTRLPGEYQEVEYIESTGTQYIQLPFGFDNTDEVIIRGSLSLNSGDDNYMVAPQRWNTNRNRFAMIGRFNSFAVAYGESATPSTRLTPHTSNDGEIYTWTYASYLFKLKELNLGLDVSNIFFGGTTANLRLFYGYSNNTTGKIAYYEHKKLNGDVYELVSCYRKSDGKPGMYDIVNDVFYTNAGTGEFTVGEDVFTLPPEYQLVSYIESTGTQYIDTGYYPNQDTVLTGKYYVQNITGVVAFARWSGAPEYDTFGLYNGGTGLTTVYYGRYSDNKYIGNIGGMVNTIVDVNIGLTSITLNNNQYNITRAQFQSPYSLYLFAGNNMGTLANQSHCKIYRMTIRENSTVKLDFVPCYRKSDEKPGLYDMMSNTFYTNDGTGEFVIGPEHYPLPSGYQQVDYLESSGTQAINTEIPISTIGNNSTNFRLRFAVPANNNGGTLMGANDSRKQMVLTGQRLRTDWVNGSSSGYLVTGLPVLPPYIIEQKDGYLSCNGQSAEITTTATGTLPCGLFARIDNAAGTSLNNLATTRIYGFAAENSGGAICDMVPCYRKSDNEPGMYDLVREAFYTNVGTGAFTLGPNV